MSRPYVTAEEFEELAKMVSDHLAKQQKAMDEMASLARNINAAVKDIGDRVSRLERRVDALARPRLLPESRS